MSRIGLHELVECYPRPLTLKPGLLQQYQGDNRNPILHLSTKRQEAFAFQKRAHV